MNTRQMIQALISKGYQVEYVERKGGGIRITKIGDLKFKSNFSLGNQYARELLGVSLSQAYTKHLEQIKTPKGLSMDKRRKAPIAEEIRKQIRRVNRKLRKQGLSSGYVTITNYRRNVSKYGEEEANRLLSQAEKYSRGEAYTDNIMHFKQRLEMDVALNPNEQAIFQSTLNKLDKIIALDGAGMLDRDLTTLYEILYEYEKMTMKTRDAASAMNKVLNQYV